MTDQEITKLTDEATALMLASQDGIDDTRVTCIHPACVHQYEGDRPAREAFTRHVLATRDAEVEALKARIALLDWVPVSERMPTEADASKNGYVEWTDGKIRWDSQWGSQGGSPGVPNWTHWRRHSLPEKSDPVREAFEAWAIGPDANYGASDLDRYRGDGDLTYCYAPVEHDWNVWIAAQNALKSA